MHTFSPFFYHFVIFCTQSIFGSFFDKIELIKKGSPNFCRHIWFVLFSSHSLCNYFFPLASHDRYTHLISFRFLTCLLFTLIRLTHPTALVRLLLIWSSKRSFSWTKHILVCFSPSVMQFSFLFLICCVSPNSHPKALEY